MCSAHSCAWRSRSVHEPSAIEVDHPSSLLWLLPASYTCSRSASSCLRRHFHDGLSLSVFFWPPSGMFHFFGCNQDPMMTFADMFGMAVCSGSAITLILL